MTVEVKRRKSMRKECKAWFGAATIMGLLTCMIGAAMAQGSQSGQGSKSQPPAQQTDKNKTPEVTPLTLDAPAPASAEEDVAYKAFAAVIQNDAAKKIELGEAFMQKYPESRYKSPVYGALTFAYVQVGNMEKMREVGEKDIALMPNDVSTLSLMARTLPRSLNPSAPDAMQVLAKAEQYSKQAIEIAPTLPRPEGMTEEGFASANNHALTLTHRGSRLTLAPP